MSGLKLIGHIILSWITHNYNYVKYTQKIVTSNIIWESFPSEFFKVDCIFTHTHLYIYKSDRKYGGLE